MLADITNVLSAPAGSATGNYLFHPSGPTGMKDKNANRREYCASGGHPSIAIIAFGSFFTSVRLASSHFAHLKLENRFPQNSTHTSRPTSKTQHACVCVYCRTSFPDFLENATIFEKRHVFKGFGGFDVTIMTLGHASSISDE